MPSEVVMHDHNVEACWSRMQVEFLDRQSSRTRIPSWSTRTSSTSRSGTTADAVTALWAGYRG
jgi:hypothetical protein